MPEEHCPEFFTLQRAVAGRYSLEREVGRGGMGVVFLARDVALDRLVAIKLLPPDLAAQPELRTRFLREARTAAGVSHPNIVPVHSVEEGSGLVFFVMGFVDGETLGQRVRRSGPLASAEAVRTIQEIAWSLAHAHARGVIHRDIKPDNVLLERDTGRVLVTDFGIARALESEDTPSSDVILGTPHYMSPEQGRGEPADQRSDLYALGVTAFYATSGRLPFEASSVAGLLAKHASEPAPPVLSVAPKLPRRFAAAIDRCLAKDPHDRFTTAEDLAEELRVARGVAVELPLPLRRFARDADAIGREAGGYLAGAVTTAAVLQAFKLMEGDFFGIVTAIQLVMLGVMTGLSGTRVGQLSQLARDLLREGFDHQNVRAALTFEERRRLEELESQPPRGRLGGWLTAGSGAAASALGLLIMGSDDMNTVVEVVGWLLAIGAPMRTVRRLTGGTRTTKLWHKLLRGRLGRWAFRIGGIGLGELKKTLPAADEPTVVAMGRAAEDLFAALPKGDRKHLADVPTLIGRLEADALALRSDADRDGGNPRMATVVAALETLRLDLLQLHSGKGSLDELTQDLEAARRIGEEIRTELEARREVVNLGDTR